MKVAALCSWLGVAAALCMSGAGCLVEQSVGPGAYDGDIVLTWSIDGDSSGAQCGPHNAAQIEVKIIDPSGNEVDDWTVPCDAEGTDETLPPGVYTATAQLEDANGNPVTTADPTPISISSDSSSQPVDFDFEEDSFTNKS